MKRCGKIYGALNQHSVFLLVAFLLILSACEHNVATDEKQGDMALLAQESNGFTKASRSNRIAFPVDHGSHSEYWMEWWYVTANLVDKEGGQYGVQWTLFRLAGQPELRWWSTCGRGGSRRLGRASFRAPAGGPG